jgi:hypothetical protein
MNKPVYSPLQKPTDTESLLFSIIKLNNLKIKNLIETAEQEFEQTTRDYFNNTSISVQTRKYTLNPDLKITLNQLNRTIFHLAGHAN